MARGLSPINKIAFGQKFFRPLSFLEFLTWTELLTIFPITLRLQNFRNRWGGQGYKMRSSTTTSCRNRDSTSGVAPPMDFLKDAPLSEEPGLAFLDFNSDKDLCNHFRKSKFTRGQEVPVLVDESVDVVANVAGEMPDDENRRVDARPVQ